jgi:hypothetical protein
MRLRKTLWVVILSLVVQLPAGAQTISSSIFGTVIDSQGGAVAEAMVTAVDMDRKISTSTKTENDGSFVFPNVPAGHYTVTVEKTGFKKFERADVILDAFTNLNVGKLTLQVGAITETVTVAAQGLQLQTESVEHSATIISKQLENLEVNGRTPLAFLRTVPGVYSDLDPHLVGIGIGNVYTNGSRGIAENVTLDGAANQDMGGNSRMLATLSLEALSEFRVLTNSYDARYGRSSGAQIVYVTKSGTSDFHGEGYWFYRDRALNANSWDNEQQTPAAPKGAYHFNYAGYNVGGPAYIPGKFNTRKDKVFFFWSDEYQPQTYTTGLHRITVPTAQERLGNFANPYNASGGGCAPGQYLNITASSGPACKNLTIPSGATLYQSGLSIMKIYPLPNVNAAVDCPQATNYSSPAALALTGGGACNGFNYVSQLPNVDNRHEQLLRIDSNLTKKWRLFGSYTHLVKDPDTSPYCPTGSGYSLCGNIPLVSGGYIYNHPGHVLALNVSGTLSPSLTVEGQFNYSHRRSSILPAAGINGLAYSAFGITSNMLPTIFAPYPSSWIPNIVMGENVGNSPVLRQNGEWAPFYTYASPLEWIGNVSKVWRNHLFLGGIYVQRMHKNQTAFVSTPGTYNFSSPNASFPGDTQYGYGNLAYGLVSSFYQANDFANGQYRYTNIEEYVQDTWKLTRRFTFVYGVRLYWVQPQYDQALQTSNFLPNQWNATQEPRLYYRLNCPNTIDPACTSGTEAYDSPLDGGTGATVQNPGYIGRIVPGSGNLLNGIAQPGKNINKYLMQGNGLLPAPRLGLTVDLTGHSNVVFRAGGGIYYDRYQGNEIFNLITNPPTIQVPTLVNVLASNITLGAGATVPPGVPGLTAISFNAKVPASYNMSAGIQAKLPWSTVLDVSYVGSMGRELLYNQNINGVPYGANFLAANQDPQKPASTLPGATAYDGNYLRQFRGYGGITLEQFGATSNYNSLQVTADRRFAKGLFLGASYAYSKCLTWASDDGGGQGNGYNTGARIDGLTKLANYGRCNFDIRQNFTFNYVYSVPSLAAHFEGLNNIVGRAVFGGWQVSGITTFRNGTPFAPSLSQLSIGGRIYGGSNIMGTGDGGSPRLALVGNPLAGTNSSSPYTRLNPGAFAPPTVLPLGTAPGASVSPCAGNANTLCLNGTTPFSIGLDSPVNYLTGPGVNNWDISLMKSFSPKERVHLRFRVDAFNAFNHVQFGGINSGMNFSCTGVNSAGQATGCTLVNAAFNSSGVLVNPTGLGTVSGSRGPRILQTMVKLEF